MIRIFGSAQALVRIDMTMPAKPEAGQGPEISPWEREAYGEGGRFGSLTSIPSGDPSKDKINVSFGGCGFNVARYLAEKDMEVCFTAVLGEDPLGLAVREDLRRAGVDLSGAISSEHMTSVRVEARNFLGDMEFWREDESIFGDFTPEKAKAAAEDLDEGDIAFADGSLPLDTLKALGEACREKGAKLFFDPASLEGAARGGECLEYFRGIMPGRREAEIMSDLEILSADQMKAAGELFAGKGIEKVAISIKGGGIYFKEGEKEDIIRPLRVIRFAETVGAGDVMTAEMLAAFAEGKSMEEAAASGMEAAAEFLSDVVDERKY